MFAQLRGVDGLDAVACNWAAASSNSGGSGTELSPACIAVKTLLEHEAPDLSAVAVGQCCGALMPPRLKLLRVCVRRRIINHLNVFKGAVAAFTQGACSDALEFQIHLKVRCDCPALSAPPLTTCSGAIGHAHRSCGIV
jgi:hypothetical protein